MSDLIKTRVQRNRGLLLYKKWVAVLCLLPMGAWAGNTMTLEEAERYSISHAPEVHQLQQQSDAFKQSAIADKALPDPKMSLGVANVPTDTFSFTQENMTQIQVGLMESFPKGDSLQLRSEQDLIQSASSEQQVKLMQLSILKTIRTQWLSLYLWENSLKVYEAQEKLFKQLVETSEAHLANNKSQQKDAVRAQLALSQLGQKILDAKQQIAMLESQLGRWLEVSPSQLAVHLPHWGAPPNRDDIAQAIKTHPQLKVDQLQSDVSQKGIELAEQQYKPGITAGVVYGLREGDDSMGNSRSDFVGAQVSFDLPFFTANLQDPQLAASKAKYLAMQDKAQADYQDMLSTLNATYAQWQYLQSQQTLYQTQLLSQASMYAKATEVAYQNQQTDFPTLVSAYIQDYETQLAYLKVQVGQLTAQVNLMYLQGTLL